MEQAHIDRIAEVILAYLASHPNASDSVDGVRRFWLGASAEAAPEIVVLALEQLERHHVVGWRLLPDGERLYAARHTGTTPRSP